MRELPITMTGESVRAILAGTKTQTRRVIPHKLMANADLDANDPRYIYVTNKYGDSHHIKDCAPYRKGDMLWVREAWQYWDWTEDGDPWIKYAADGAKRVCGIPDSGDSFWEMEVAGKIGDVCVRLSKHENYVKHGYMARGDKWRNPMFMFKHFARIWLRVTDVRAELLQDISEDDARMEGVSDPWNYQIPEYYEDVSVRHRDYYAAAFAGRWDRLNNKRGHPWDSNPWVWVYEFRKVKK